MHRTYRYATTLSFGTDGEPGYTEVDVEVSFSVAWGSPESGRFGPPEDYDPGCGDEVEGIKLLTVDAKPRPWDMGYGFVTDDTFAEMVADRLDDERDAMIAAAIQDEVAARDSYLEAEADERRLERRF